MRPAVPVPVVVIARSVYASALCTATPSASATPTAVSEPTASPIASVVTEAVCDASASKLPVSVRSVPEPMDTRVLSSENESARLPATPVPPLAPFSAFVVIAFVVVARSCRSRAPVSVADGASSAVVSSSAMSSATDTPTPVLSLSPGGASRRS